MVFVGVIHLKGIYRQKTLKGQTCLKKYVYQIMTSPLIISYIDRGLDFIISIFFL